MVFLGFILEGNIYVRIFVFRGRVVVFGRIWRGRGFVGRVGRGVI